MNPWRARLVNCVIAAIAGGHLYDMLAGKEHWPFSGYPMFAQLYRGSTWSTLHLFGVTTEDAPREVLLMAPEYIWPFDESRLRVALGRLASSPSREDRLREALGDVLERYEARRAACRHDGPAIAGVRLYRVVWHLDSRGRNRGRADERTLVCELVRPTTRGAT